MRLEDLLKDLNYKKIYGSTDIWIKNLSINSKNVLPNSLFIAIEGFKRDGHNFTGEAIKNGAVAMLVQKKIEIPPDITQIVVSSTREALPILCRNFYQDPSKSFKLIGVTGTNGKTTTCYLINSILNSAGLATSIITTVESFLDGEKFFFDRTTPESIDLNKFFKRSRHKNVNAACIEVSSHSIDLHRVDYLKFDYFIFTNLSQDHLDYHRNMADYFNVKKRLFSGGYRDIYGGKKAVINIDDSYGKRIYKATDLKKISYSLESDGANIWAGNIRNSISGIEMDINTSDGKKFKISSPLCGYFNIYNILAAVGVCMDMDINISFIQKGIKSVYGVKGRFERINTDKKLTVIVDYAHTPDSLKNVLKTIREMLKSGGKLISVFGCGGDRDKGKRKIMGRISGELADFTVITSDNPRTEEPDSIISMIEEGLIKSAKKKYIKEVDRKKAIFKALKMAKGSDVVLVAGKGHEDYQEFNGYRIPFCDKEVVREWAGQEK